MPLWSHEIEGVLLLRIDLHFYEILTFNSLKDLKIVSILLSSVHNTDLGTQFLQYTFHHCDGIEQLKLFIEKV